MNDAATTAPPWPPLLAAKGRFSQSAPHAHHGMHIVVAIDGALRARVGDEPFATESAGIITAPDVAHEINFGASDVLLVFIDPESDIGASLRATFEGDARRILDAERAAIDCARSPMEIMRTGGVGWLRSVLSALGVALPTLTAKMHPAVQRVLSLARTMDDETLSLASLSASVGLSEGRLMHAFTDSVGIPLRPYLAWLRVQRAVAAIAAGSALTEAALAAGFSDAAHMSRTFRKMLGLAPSELRAAIVASPFKTEGEGGPHDQRR